MMIVAFAGFSAAMNAQDAPATAPDPNAADIKWESTAIDYGNVKKVAQRENLNSPTLVNHH